MDKLRACTVDDSDTSFSYHFVSQCWGDIAGRKIAFRKMYGMVIKSSIIFLLYKLVIIFVLLMVDVDKVEDLMKADKFSLLTVIGEENVPKWSSYPFHL